MKKWYVWLIIPFIFAIIGGAGYLGAQSGPDETPTTLQAPTTVAVTRGEVRQTVTAPGQVVGRREALLGFEISGQLAEILVQPGQVVQSGQVLARLKLRPLEEALETAQLKLAQGEAQHRHDLAEAKLDLRIAETELKQEQANQPVLTATEAALAAAQAELAELQAGPDKNEMTVAAAELRQVEIALKQAQWAYDQVAYRGDVGAMAEATKLEESTLDYEAKLARYNLAIQGATAADIANARAKVQQAQADYDQARVEQGVSSQKLDILAARVEKVLLTLEKLQAGVDPALSQAVKEAEANLKAATLTAPYGGVILELQAKPGETVLDGAGVVLLTDTKVVEVWTKVIEEDLPLVQVGQKVEVFFDAVPDVVVPGHVVRIVPQRLSGEDRPLYPVYISLDELPEGIIPGMTADASIIIAQKSNVLRLPRALVQVGADDLAVVEVWANNQIERHEVQVGLRGDVYVEIMAGLKEGDQVVGQ